MVCSPQKALFSFFFFQAEDGIRDYKVTGVQTCALPIWWRRESQGLEPRDVAEQAGQRLVACEAAAVEYQPALERLGGKRQVVRDHEQRHAPGRAVEQGARDACPQRPIEPDGRLVEHEQRRLERQRAGERGELTEGRREVVGVVPGVHGEVEVLERAVSPPL